MEKIHSADKKKKIKNLSTLQIMHAFHKSGRRKPLFKEMIRYLHFATSHSGGTTNMIGWHHNLTFCPMAEK